MFMRTKGNGDRVYLQIVENRRVDGKWVLTTNTDLTAKETALKYKQLWMVESIFRSMKSLLQTRPIYHKCDDPIRGHVWCSFLALIVRKELPDRLEEKRTDADEPPLEWADIVRDSDNLVETEMVVNGKRYIVRTDTKPAAAKVFKACGVARAARPAPVLTGSKMMAYQRQKCGTTPF